MTGLQFEQRADGIAVLRIDVADRPMNVLTPALTDALSGAIDRIATSAEITGAILTSGKAGSFVAGADLKDFVTLYQQGITPQQARDIGSALSSLYRRLETCGKPVVAAINGLALGGGLELALACHYRILLDDPKAVVGLPEVKVGLLPGAGGTQRLPRLIGIAGALPLMLEGRHVKPAEALRLGIVDALASAETLFELAIDWLSREPQPTAPWDRKGYEVPGGAGPLASAVRNGLAAATAAVLARSGRNEPAPLAILSSVYEGTITSFEVGLRIESKYFGTLLAGPVARNLMRTMFIHKPALDKLAHRPAGVPKSKPSRVAIVGEGPQTQALAEAFTAAGIQPGGPTSEADLVVATSEATTTTHAGRAWLPAPAASVLQICAGVDTDPRWTAQTFDLAAALRKTPILLGSGNLRGFCERLRGARSDETAALLAEGVSPTLIENGAHQVGLAPLPVSAPEAEVAPINHPPTVEQIAERLLTIQALEAARQLDAGQIVHADDADVASVFGSGYPAWTGGALSYIDTMGVSAFVATCERLAAVHGPRFAPTGALQERAAQGRLFHPRGA